MQDRLNKPRVFLSHAWKNKPFIERLANDLRRCQIDYWLDQEEIRDGRSWLKMIFEDGIPTCDAVLVYLTKESLNSKMVERELDAAVVHQLHDAGVTLLPYVSDASLRRQLRSDLQTIQCREWNDQNYHFILPTVVAEIWRSYLERKIDAAVLQEKNRRLEQELENKRLLEQFESSVFSPRETQEFKYLHKRLSAQVEVVFNIYTNYRDENLRRRIGTEVCRLSILRMLFALVDIGLIVLDAGTLWFYLPQALGETMVVDGREVTRASFGETIDSKVAAQILKDLQKYGLAKLRTGNQGSYGVTDKVNRFKYWLEYNDLLVDEGVDHTITLGVKESSISEQPTEEGSVTAKALAVDKKIQQARLRKAWRTNGEGTQAVLRDIQTIIANLKGLITQSNEVLRNIKLGFDSTSNGCTIKTGDVALTLEAGCHGQNTDDCVIRAYVVAPKLGVQVGSESPDALQQIFLRTLRVRVDNNLQLKWSAGDSVTWTAPKLADYLLSTFLQIVQQNEEKY